MAKSDSKKVSKRPSRRLKKRRNAASTTKSVDPIPVNSLIRSALQLQQSGELSQAESIYRKVLDRDPENPDAWHLLGMTLFALKRYEAAIECLEKALRIVQRHPEVMANLGVVYRSSGRLDDAKSVLLQAVAIEPNSASLQSNLGTVYLELDELELAERHFENALAIDGQFGQAAMNLGNLWQQQGRFADAETVYQNLLERRPGDAAVLNNLGETLRHLGKSQQAVKVLNQAVESEPDCVEYRINLGRVLSNVGRIDEARSHFEKLIESFPELTKPFQYLGKLQLAQRELTDAVANLESAVELDPKDGYALTGLGLAYLESGRVREAEVCFRSVIELDPAMSQAHGLLLYVLSGDASIDPQRLFEEHQNWGRIHGNVVPVANEFQGRSRAPDRRLRVGYVSPDFRSHAVASYLEPVLEAHDPTQVEIFSYAEVTAPDETTRRLQELSHHWRFTPGFSDRQVAEQVLADQIDILVDLAGHTGQNRLGVFAHRPAPLQATWLGYPNTTGLSSIDYRFTCSVQNPIDEKTFHTEELFRLPRASFCFSRPFDWPTSKLPAISNGYVTLGSLHRPEKISESARDLWAETLDACPNSRLIVFNTRFTSESKNELIAGLARRGIGAERIEIRNLIEGESYLETYQEIDIALDVTPWAGGTTTLESLWMGVPVIAYLGHRRSARSTAAIIHHLGCKELIADSFAKYAQIVVELSDDLPRLESLRKSLRRKVETTLVDSNGFTRDLEQAYREMWNRWTRS